MHRWSTEKTCELIEEIYKELEDSIVSTIESLQRPLLETKGKLKKIEESADDLKVDVASALKLVENARIVTPYPKEPVFPEFPPIEYVLPLPTTGSKKLCVIVCEYNYSITINLYNFNMEFFKKHSYYNIAQEIFIVV